MPTALACGSAVAATRKPVSRQRTVPSVIAGGTPTIKHVLVIYDVIYYILLLFILLRLVINSLENPY